MENDGTNLRFRVHGYTENMKNLEADNDAVNPPFLIDGCDEYTKNFEPVMLPVNRIVTGHFNDDDIGGMPDNPPKYTGHRRAHSELVTILDEISFDSDLGVVGCQETEEEEEEDLFSSKPINAKPSPDNRVTKHQHSLSMDGSTFRAFSQEETLSGDPKKWMADNKLADVVLVDPKRAKRISANRQSAARSKQRKIFYIAELESKVHTLQTEKTSISAQVPHLQREIHILSTENNDLKLRLQAMVQQARLQDAMSDSLRKEIHHLKVVTGQNLTNNGPIVNLPPLFGPNRFQPNNQAGHTILTSQQFQSQNQNHVFQKRPLHYFQHHFHG